MKMKLLYVNRYGVMIDQAMYVVGIAVTSDEDRRVILSRIEEQEDESKIRFKAFEKCVALYYNEADNSFKQVRAVTIQLRTPEEMAPTEVATFIQNLIS